MTAEDDDEAEGEALFGEEEEEEELAGGAHTFGQWQQGRLHAEGPEHEEELASEDEDDSP